MRAPNPTVILIPGLGMIAFGKDKSESRVTAEFYHCAVEVMRGAEALDQYIGLPQQEAFDIEYWLLEEAKLKRMPPEKELARQVIAVVGAGSGIGREVAQRLVKDGAQVVCVDLNAEAAKETAKAVEAKHGTGIGVAGSGPLVRELAVELAPLVRVNGVAPATVVQGSAMFPRDRVVASLTKYGIPFSEVESDDSLREKLARFYADRTLTKSPITPADQAEAFFLLVSNRLSRTTGQIITVDGGLHEAFLR